MASVDPRSLGDLEHRIDRITPLVLAAEQILPVPDVFSPLLPGGGLQRGWITRVEGDPSARAVAWALVGEVTTAGGWVAAVDLPGIGLSAAREVGVAIERVLVVTCPDASSWSAAIGALIGSVDVVVFGGVRRRVGGSEQRRLASRARERGTVLMEVAPAADTPQLQYDVTFTATPVEWIGLGEGHGCLRSRALEVQTSGRRIAGRVRRARLELPAADGSLRCLEPPATVTELRAV